MVNIWNLTKLKKNSIILLRFKNKPWDLIKVKKPLLFSNFLKKKSLKINEG